MDKERELSEELEFYRALKERKYRELGLSPQQAADQAQRDFGGYEKFKELCREVGRWRWLDDLARDLTLAFRTLRKSPVFTAVALITLTLAIGANTAIFSLMNELLLKTVPVPDPQKLAILSVRPADAFGYSLSYPLFKQIEQQSASVMQAFAFGGDDLQWHSPNGAEQVQGQLVSGNYFPALGVQPAQGRWITPADDKRGAPNGAVAVISDHFWRTGLNSDKQAVGRRITLGQGVFTIIGVMPESFRGMNKDLRSDIFLPLELEPLADAPENSLEAGNGMWWLRAGARLNKGVSLAQANAYLTTTSPRIFQAAAGPEGFEFSGRTARDFSLAAEPGETGFSFLRLRYRKALLILMALVAMVLLIACLNLATLLMARAASRSREISTRFALGASRARLLRQLLTESLLLAVAGSLLGLSLSPLLVHSIAAGLNFRLASNSIVFEATPDAKVFLFTAAIAIVATVLTGTIPALQSTRDGLHSFRRRKIAPRILMSLQVALALVMITGATLLGSSLFQLDKVSTGFNPHGVAFFSLDFDKQARKPPALAAVYRDLVSEIRHLPQVTSASFSQIVPLTLANWHGSASVPGGAHFKGWQNKVGPDYFATLETPILQGREFRWSDAGTTVQHVILSESAARILFPSGGAVGKRVKCTPGEPAEVIGIVADTRHLKLRKAPEPTIYLSALEDLHSGASYNLLVRTSGPTAPLSSAVGQLVRRAVPDIPLPVPFTLEQTIAESIATERTMATLALFFGALALFMTGIGLYGTLAYSTERRTSEIGIRLALGAMPRHVIALVCADNGAIALIGCALGLSMSAAASKTIASFLYGVSPQDPLLFSAAALLLITVGAAASLLPARKAARIDPLTAIRYE